MCFPIVDKIINLNYLFRSSSANHVSAKRLVTLLKKTPSNVFFKDSAKTINCLFYISK